jgi:tetratricopeptide (TPR) repeat protein
LGEQTQAEFYIQQGDRSREQGQLEEATAWYRRAIELNPSSTRAYVQLAETLKQWGNFKASAFCYYQAIVLKAFQHQAARDSEEFPQSSKLGSKQEIGMDEFLASNSESDTPSSSQIVKENYFPAALESEAIDVSPVGNPSHETQVEVAKIYFQQAVLLCEQKHWERAIIACERVLQIAPEMADAHKLLGDILQEVGEFAEAMGHYAKALEIQPNFVEVYANLGSILARRQQWQQSVIYYQKALEFNPRSAKIFRNLAKVWKKLDQPRKAIDCKYQALKLEPEKATLNQYVELGNDLSQQGLLVEASFCYRYAIQRNPNWVEAYQKLAQTLEKQEEWQESARVHANLGSLYAGQQQWQTALSYYRKALKLDPKLAGVYRNIGRVLEQTGLPEQAAEAWYRGLKLEPSAATAEDYLKLGERFLDCGKLGKTASCYRQAIRLQTDLFEAYHRLGDVLLKQGKQEEAIATYRQAIHQNFQDAESHFRLGEAFAAAEQWQEAIACYRRAIAVDPGQWLVQHNLGNAFIKLQQWEDAIAAYRSAINADPNQSWTHNNLGDALVKLQRWDEAVEAYRRAIDLKPDYCWSHYNLGDALVQLQRWDEAVEAYRHAIEQKPDHSWSYYNLGDAFVQLQRWNEAARAYHHALQLNPDSPMISQKLAEALQRQGQSYFEEASRKYQQISHQYPDNLEICYKTLEIQPNNPEIYLKLGNTLVNHNRLNAAIFYYQMGLKVLPDFLEIPAQLEMILEKSAEREGTALLKKLHEILQKKLDAPEVYARLRDVLVDAGKLKEALLFNQKLRNFQHLYAEIYFQLANTLSRQYLFEQALTPYRRSIKLNPDRGWYYKSLADSFTVLCQFEEAILAYEKALKIEPNNPQFFQSLNEAKVYQRQWNKVTKYCQEASKYPVDIKNKTIDVDRPLRILILTSYPPYPPTSGGAIRMFEKIKYLSQRHHVAVVSYIFDESEYEIENALDEYCDLIALIKIGTPLSTRQPDEPIKIHWWTTQHMWRTLEQLRVVDFDIVSFEFIFMAPYQKLFEHCFTILEEHNIESDLLFQCQTNVDQNDVDQTATEIDAVKAFQNADKEARLLWEYENQVWPLFNLRTVVSELDRQKLESRCKEGKTIVVGNGVDTRNITLIKPRQASKKLLYMGHMGYYPNIDATIYLAERILPIVWQQDSEICLCIAGREPGPQVENLAIAENRIEIIANPESMNPLAEDSIMTVVPLRLGSGTRLKILHAMAMGLPAISTRIGAEGLAVNDGVNILLRDEPETFAAGILQLSADADLRNRLRLEGRRLVEETYDWQILYANYEREVLSSMVSSIE